MYFLHRLHGRAGETSLGFRLLEGIEQSEGWSVDGSVGQHVTCDWLL
jgi:hypothetical protein